MSTQTLPNAAPAPRRRWLSIIFGLLLLLPAAGCCLSTLLSPTVQTVLLSLQDFNGLGVARFIGGANFARLASLPLVTHAIAFTLEFALVRLLAVAILPVLLALAAAALNGWLRGGLRLLFTLPLVVFAPTALAVAWIITRAPGGSTPLTSPSGAQGTLLALDGAQTLGLACGVGLIAYLAALRVRAGGPSAWAQVRGPLLVLWLVSGLAALASGLQVFTLPFLLTRGGPAFSTVTLMLAQYQMGFVNFQFGAAAAVAVLALVPLLLIGLVVGLLVVLTGLRLEPLGAAQPTSPLLPGLLAVLVVIVLALLGLALWLSGVGPLFRALLLGLGGGGNRAAEAGAAQTGVASASLIGPLSVLLIQLPLAYLAALGVGALRPLGRWSEWLLLPFSPWLFVTIGPLSLAAFMSLRQTGQVNTLVALASPILVSVPMLFVLALFFKGRLPRYQQARAGGQGAFGAGLRQYILPSLPLALLLGVLGVLAANQELLWPLLAANRPELFTGNVALANLFGRQLGQGKALAGSLLSVVLPGMVFGLLALGLLQIFYVGRLALRTGKDTDG